MAHLAMAGYVAPAHRAAVLISCGRRCVACGARGLIQVDHVWPVAAGGRSVMINLAGLCQPCNLIKSCFWPGHGYHPWPGCDDIGRAAEILAAELAWLRERYPDVAGS